MADSDYNEWGYHKDYLGERKPPLSKGPIVFSRGFGPTAKRWDEMSPVQNFENGAKQRREEK